MMKKEQGALPSVEHHYHGNTNVIAASVNASTIIAGDGNSISSLEKQSKSETDAEEGKIVNIQNTIFISHRSTDKMIADMLLDFFIGTGVPRNAVFCSSLPGNDIREKISGEVKAALHSSTVNIAILSKEYYESAYCLNEAGILWYLDESTVIPIALPEITHDKMVGFLNDEYKTRSLSSEDDIAYIYDAIVERLHISQVKSAIFREEARKLKEKYESYLKRGS